MDRYFKKLIRNYFSNVVITQSFVRKGGQDTPVLLAPIGGISCDPSTPRVTNRRKQS